MADKRISKRVGVFHPDGELICEKTVTRCALIPPGSVPKDLRDRIDSYFMDLEQELSRYGAEVLFYVSPSEAPADYRYGALEHDTKPISTQGTYLFSDGRGDDLRLPAIKFVKRRTKQRFGIPVVMLPDGETYLLSIGAAVPTYKSNVVEATPGDLYRSRDTWWVMHFDPKTMRCDLARNHNDTGMCIYQGQKNGTPEAKSLQSMVESVVKIHTHHNFGEKLLPCTVKYT